MKRCSLCSQEKSIQCFHKGRTRCKECRKKPNHKDIEIKRLKKELEYEKKFGQAMLKQCQDMGRIIDDMKKNISKDLPPWYNNI